MPTIRPSSSPSNKYKDVLCVRLSSKFPTQAPRARGIAMVKPSWPINASDPQTEGGGFLFIRCFSSVFSRYYTMRIIAHWNIYLQQLIQSCCQGRGKPGPGRVNCKMCKIIREAARTSCEKAHCSVWYI